VLSPPHARRGRPGFPHPSAIWGGGSGRVEDSGTHQELMVRNGRYRTMFDLQARRFNLEQDEEGVPYERLS